MAARAGKKNGAEAHAVIARAWGNYLLADTMMLDANSAAPPDLLSAQMPSLFEATGVVAHSAALLVRTLIIQSKRMKHDTKRRCCGAALLALADLLTALDLPDALPYHLRD